MDDYSARLLQVTKEVVDAWSLRLLQGTVIARGSALPLTSEMCDEVTTSVRQDVTVSLSELLTTDVLAQRVNPLTIFRSATQPITDALLAIGVPSVQRDEFNVRSFPLDVFALCPATWGDIDERLIEPGLEWGAFKAASVIMHHKTV